MVRVSSKADKQAVPVAATPAPENVVEKTAKPRATKKAAVPAAEPAVAAAAPAADAAVDGLDVESSVAARITEFSAKLQQIGSIFTTMKTDFKNLEKAVSRELKNAQKSSSKPPAFGLREADPHQRRARQVPRQVRGRGDGPHGGEQGD